ncbi:prepilin-type N-terminal cleavage/methylation domain-containing protein [Myxococcota bacterium]|nr:prepilin-type N-terminal cleavage/methylation domain-containing protein [Myxococcota bacterium]
MNQPRSKNKSSRGFTLIEVMLVVAILGIIAGLAAPRFSKMLDRNALGAEIRLLLGAFLEAQGYAATTGYPSRLVLDRVNNTWEVWADTSGNGSLQRKSRHVVSEQRNVFFGPAAGTGTALPSPLTTVPHASWCTACGADNGHIEFEPSGVISNSDAGVILLQHPSFPSDVRALVYIGPTGSSRLLRTSP